MSEITRTISLPGGGRTLSLHRFRLSHGELRAAFGQRVVTLGAAPGNDFVVEAPTVSRYHARIEVSDTGYRLLDVGSKNGTSIQGVRVRDAYLTPGQRFRLGEAEVLFEMDADTVEVRVSGKDRFGDMLGTSEVMREVFGLLERVAQTDATVLVEGKSGTGKELVARAIHDKSARAAGPVVVFDCSAVSRELIESELFGHAKGAFTGAIAARKGAFERAEGGTLFIDELGELAPELQPKLLRALESRRVQPVGGGHEVPVNVRIVAATNRTLRDEVRSGNFREDLYYRFAVITVRLPPLAERREDIPLLVDHFLADARQRMGTDKLNIGFSTMEKLKSYDWPGNVRELRNFIERAVVLATGSRLETKFLQVDRPQAPAQPTGDLLSSAGVDMTMPFKQAKSTVVESFESAYWRAALRESRGNISQAARLGGVHRKSLEYILKKLDIDRAEFE